MIKQPGMAELDRAVRHGVTAGVSVEELRERVIDLSLCMTRRLVGRVVETDPTMLDEIYTRCVEDLGELRPATVTIHPSDRKLARVDLLAGARGFELVENESVGRGGCVVEACGLKVDARVDAMLDALERALKGDPVG